MRFTTVFQAAFVGAVLLALPGVLTAQSAPNLVHLQAHLASTVNGPLSGAASVTVRVYAVPSGGVPLWEETQAVTAVDGTVSLLLGSVTQPPVDLFDGGDRYLALQVDNDSEMTPRRLIGSTPYARRAA